ncbi:MAG TPA: hypothetical protein VIL32_00235 [Steroidobacteraceae bacterium]
MRSAGERIRVTAQLIDAESGYHLWSRSFDREMRDIFRLQDEFAQSIVSALHGPTPHDSAEMLTTPPTADVEAYRLYLQGNCPADAPVREEPGRGECSV